MASDRHNYAYVRTVDPCEGLVRLSVHHGVRRAHDEGGEELGGRVYVQTRQVRARRRRYLKLRLNLILGIGPLTLLKPLQKHSFGKKAFHICQIDSEYLLRLMLQQIASSCRSSCHKLYPP